MKAVHIDEDLAARLRKVCSEVGGKYPPPLSFRAAVRAMLHAGLDARTENNETKRNKRIRYAVKRLLPK
jgi:hypothetical protein